MRERHRIRQPRKRHAVEAKWGKKGGECENIASKKEREKVRGMNARERKRKNERDCAQDGEINETWKLELMRVH